MRRIVFLALIPALVAGICSCVSNPQQAVKQAAFPAAVFTFEPDSPIETWLAGGSIYAASENKASAESVSPDSAAAK